MRKLAVLTEGYRAYQRLHHDRLTRPYADAVATVRTLHKSVGHPMAVVTSKADDLAHRSVAHVGLGPYLPVIIGVNSTTRHKPDPEPVRVALERLGTPAAGACRRRLATRHRSRQRGGRYDDRGALGAVFAGAAGGGFTDAFPGSDWGVAGPSGPVAVANGDGEGRGDASAEPCCAGLESRPTESGKLRSRGPRG